MQNDHLMQPGYISSMDPFEHIDRCASCGGWTIPEKYWDKVQTNSGECSGSIPDTGICKAFSPTEITRFRNRKKA